MGLLEYIKSGSALRREVISIPTDGTGIGSVNLGSAYVLLSIDTDIPCRVRLYDNQSSRDDVGEAARAFGNTSVSNSIALVGDYSMSAAGTYTTDPVMYGVTSNPTSKLSYYRIDNAPAGPPYPVIKINRFLLEDSTISTSNRITPPRILASASNDQIITGSIVDSLAPITYLLVSASTQGSGTFTRLRLYSSTGSFTNLTELSRSFSVEPSESAKLIMDGVFTNNQTLYFSPKIIGANLQNVGTDLNIIKSNQQLLYGKNEMYYAIQSLDGIVGNVYLTASLYLFSLED